MGIVRPGNCLVEKRIAPEDPADKKRRERGDLGIRDMEVGVEPTEANFSRRLRAGFSARAAHSSDEKMSNYEADYNGNREE
jgi:hypothetical protein